MTRMHPCMPPCTPPFCSLPCMPRPERPACKPPAVHARLGARARADSPPGCVCASRFTAAYPRHEHTSARRSPPSMHLDPDLCAVQHIRASMDGAEQSPSCPQAPPVMFDAASPCHVHRSQDSTTKRSICRNPVPMYSGATLHKRDRHHAETSALSHIHTSLRHYGIPRHVAQRCTKYPCSSPGRTDHVPQSPARTPLSAHFILVPHSQANTNTPRLY